MSLPILPIFFYAFAIGFVIQMPIGPTAFLCFRRFTIGGVFLATATGLGTAFGDTLYAGIAVAGLHGWAAAIERYDASSRLAGALVLIVVGAVLSLKRFEPVGEKSASRGGVYGAFASTLLMTLFNPATVVLVAGVLGSLGLSSLTATVAGASAFTLGFFIGSCCWWAFFAELLRVIHSRVGPSFFILGSRISGFAIALVGIVILVIHRFHSL
jgi:threonine/homoserine/homoserine lactone efflux protein